MRSASGQNRGTSIRQSCAVCLRRKAHLARWQTVDPHALWATVSRRVRRSGERPTRMPPWPAPETESLLRRSPGFGVAAASQKLCPRANRPATPPRAPRGSPPSGARPGQRRASPLSDLALRRSPRPCVPGTLLPVRDSRDPGEMHLRTGSKATCHASRSTLLIAALTVFHRFSSAASCFLPAAVS